MKTLLFPCARLSLFSLLLLLNFTSLSGAIKTWVGGASGGGWGTAANWSPSGAPGASDDIVINAGTSSMSFTGLSSVTIASLTINGTTGSVTWTSGAATITVTGAIISQVNVTSGTASLVTQGTGGSIAAGKTFTISSGKSFSVSTSSGTGFNVPSAATLSVLGSSLSTSTSNNAGLTVSGTLSWNNSSVVTIYPMTIQAGGVFNLMGSNQKSFSTGSPTLVYGKVSMQGTTYGGTSGTLPKYYSGSVLEYVQTAAENIGTEWPTGTTDLPPMIIINNSSGVSLTTGSARTVPLGGTLDIQSGKLTISTGDLTLETTAVVNQASPSSNYIITSTSIGKVVRKFTSAASQSFTWPIGNTTKYRPVDISITSNSSTRSIGVGTSVTAGEPHAWYACGGTCFNNDYTNSCWYVSHTGSTSMNYQFTFHYVASDFIGSTPTNMKVSRTTSGAWTPYTTTYSASPYIQMTSAVPELSNPLSGSVWMGRSCVSAPTVNITPSGSTSFCAGGSVMLTASGAGSYIWTPSTGLSSTTIANPIASPTSTQIYSVTGTDAVSGCSDTEVVTVTVTPKPVVNVTVFPNDTICEGSSVTLSGSGAFSYTWSGGVGDGVPFAPSGTATYTLIGTTSGCSDTTTQTIVVSTVPIIGATVSPSAMVCPGDSITLYGTGGISYSWTGGVTNGVAFVPISGPYTVTGTAANGCTNSASVNITVNPSPPIGAVVAPSTTVCEGESITLSGTGGVSYSWTGGVTDGVAFVPDSTTTYIVTGTDVNGCTNTSSQLITVNPMPINTVANISGTLTADQAGGTYQWLDCSAGMSPIAGIITQSWTPPVSGSYAVVITLGSCSDTSACNSVVVTSISQDSNETAFLVFPNPASDYISIVSDPGLLGEEFILLDLSGRTVLSGTLATVTTKVYVGELAKGVFLLKVRDTEKVIVRE